MLTLEVKSESVKVWLDKMPENIREHLITTTGILAEKLRTLVGSKLDGAVLKQRTGDLHNSIQQQVQTGGNEITGLVYSAGNIKYAAGLEYGTTAHVIEARTAKCLAFMVGGEMIFAKRVNHPGNKAYNYMRGSLAEMKTEIIEKLTAAAIEGTK